MNFTCPLCAKISPSAKGMGNHFTRFHGMKSEQLAHHFHTPTTCECGRPGKFLSLTLGFHSWCSNCEARNRSKSAKLMHARIKADPVRYQQFRQKTSDAVRNEWATKDQTQRLANMGPKPRYVVHSDDAEEFIKKMGTVPWTHDELNQIFEVA